MPQRSSVHCRTTSVRAAKQAHARSGLLERANRLLTGLSIVSLVLMVCVTFSGVVMRYVFNAPILGGNEVIQLLAVAVVFLAMPFAAQTEAHIRVDVLDTAIGRFGRYVGDILSRGISVFVLSILIYRIGIKALEAIEFGDTTNMLSIPLWPFYGLIALGMGLSVLQLLVQLLDILRKGLNHHE